jgi:regulator of sirC expression with transglutaminase-like and TPR domain
MDPADRFAALVRRAAPADHLDVMAGLIGCAFEPDAEVDEVVLGLDRLAAGCAPTFDAIMALFAHGPLQGNRADYGDPRNSYLHQVVRRGLGIPITLSICAMEIGRRRGVDVHGVGLPGHFLVRCGEVFGDPFHGGRQYSLDDVEPVWHTMTGTRDPLDPRLLEPAMDRSILLRMLNNLKNTFVAMDDPVPLRVLARLRGAFPELAHERAEYGRWLRHWN